MFDKAMKAGAILARLKEIAIDRRTQARPHLEINKDDILGRLEALEQKLSELNDRCSQLQK